MKLIKKWRGTRAPVPSSVRVRAEGDVRASLRTKQGAHAPSSSETTQGLVLIVLVSSNRVVLASWRFRRHTREWQRTARATRIGINEGGEDCLISLLSVKRYIARYTDVVTICPSHPSSLIFINLIIVFPLFPPSIWLA